MADRSGDERPSLEHLFALKRWDNVTLFLASPSAGLAGAAFYAGDEVAGTALVALTLFVLAVVPAAYRHAATSPRLRGAGRWLYWLSLPLNEALVVALSRVFELWPTVVALVFFFSTFWAGVYAARRG